MFFDGSDWLSVLPVRTSFFVRGSCLKWITSRAHDGVSATAERRYQIESDEQQARGGQGFHSGAGLGPEKYIDQAPGRLRFTGKMILPSSAPRWHPRRQIQKEDSMKTPRFPAASFLLNQPIAAASTKPRRTAAAGVMVLSIAATVQVGAGVAPASSPIALDPTGNRLVVVNPDADTITIFNAGAAALPKLGEVAVGDEPVSVAASGTTAYVANAMSNTVSVVDLNTLAVIKTIDVGSDPRGVALTPNGTQLFVTNAASNTVSVIQTTSNLVTATTDLSFAGLSPQAIAVTNDGDARRHRRDGLRRDVLRRSCGRERPRSTKARTTSARAASWRSRRRPTLSLGAPNPIVLGPDGQHRLQLQRPAGARRLARSRRSPRPTRRRSPRRPARFPTSSPPSRSIRRPAAATWSAPGASPNGPLRFNSMAQGLVSVFDTDDPHRGHVGPDRRHACARRRR